MPKQRNPLNTDKTWRVFFSFLIPITLSNIMEAVFEIIDQLFLSNKVGMLGNTATAIVFPLMMITSSIRQTIAFGGTTLYNMYIGKKDEKSAKVAAINAVKLTFWVTLVIAVLMWIFKKPLLTLCGATDGTSYQYAEDYLSPIIPFIPLVETYVTVNQLVSADGSPKIATGIGIFGTVLNIIFDYIFVCVFEWGVTGAGLATLIAVIIILIAHIPYAFHTKMTKFSKGEILQMIIPTGVDKPTLKEILKIGLPTGLGSLGYTATLFIENGSLKYYGNLSKYGSDIAITAAGIATRLGSIHFIINGAISKAARPLMAYNIGASNFKRARKVLKQLMIVIHVQALVVFIVTIFGTRYILMPFGITDELYLEFTDFCVKVYFILLPFLQLSAVEGDVLPMVNKTKQAFCISSLRPLMYTIMVFILPLFLGLNGVVLADTSADIMIIIFSLIFLPIMMKELKDKPKIETEVTY